MANLPSERNVRRRIENSCTSRTWCEGALTFDDWNATWEANVVLNSADDFEEAAKLIRHYESGGWKFDWVSESCDSLHFSKSIPVTEEERQQARAWMEKYNG